jgi:hypothetical protein
VQKLGVGGFDSEAEGEEAVAVEWVGGRRREGVDGPAAIRGVELSEKWKNG